MALLCNLLKLIPQIFLEPNNAFHVQKGRIFHYLSIFLLSLFSSFLVDYTLKNIIWQPSFDNSCVETVLCAVKELIGAIKVSNKRLR